MKKIISVAAIICFLMIPYASHADLIQGLVASYNFNGNANDTSGNDNNGTVYGAVLSEDRLNIADSAYWFDGSDDYVRIEDSSSLDVINGISLVAWINFESGGYKNPRIIHKQYAYDLFTQGTGDSRMVRFSLNNSVAGEEIIVNSTNLVNSGSWNFVVGTYDGSSVKLYINGALEVEESYSFDIRNSSYHVEIGRNSYNQTDDFKGYIDDVRIYDRALSRDEILGIYSVPEPSIMIFLGLGLISLIGSKRFFRKS